jgi:DNA-binding NarL/FixJ family response regulator
VIIADDDAAFAELVAGLIEADGRFEVVGVAADGEEAVQLATWQDPDVLLLDIEMPILDGLTACRLVREAKPRVCILMVSGGSPQRAQDALDAGAAGYVDKVNAPDTIISAVLALASREAATAARGVGGTQRGRPRVPPVPRAPRD